ncbi:hypothetical protein ACYOEI_00415 [Singulisphaera rosea]
MKRRATPQLESIEERVLTTVAGSHHALTTVVVRSSEPLPPLRHLWAIVGMDNMTDHVIRFHIDFYGPNGWYKQRAGTIKPHGEMVVSSEVKVPGSIPTLELTYHAATRDVSATTRLAPYLLHHEPAWEERWGSPFFYRIKEDRHDQLVVIHPKHPEMEAPPASGLSGVFLLW